MIKNKNIAPDAAIDGSKVTLAGSALASAKVFVGTSAGVAAAVTLSGDVTNTNTGVTAIGAGKVTLAMHEAASLDGTAVKVVAAENVIGGIPVVHVVDVGDVATGDTTVVLTHKTRIYDVVAIKQGAAGDNASNVLTVKNVATAITNAMDMNVADKTVVRAGTIDDAQWEVAAGANLVLSHVKAGSNSPAYTAFIYGVRVA